MGLIIIHLSRYNHNLKSGRKKPDTNRLSQNERRTITSSPGMTPWNLLFQNGGVTILHASMKLYTIEL